MDDTEVPCVDPVLEDYARKLKAIGHPIRIRLLILISREDDPCVSDMWRCLHQPQPVISQHLAILKENGIVSAEVQKTKRVYSIVDPFVVGIIKEISRHVEVPATE